MISKCKRLFFPSSVSSVEQYSYRNRIKSNQFINKNEKALFSTSIVQYMEQKMARARYEKSGKQLQRTAYVFRLSHTKEIYRIAQKYLPEMEPFWNNLFGAFLRDAERFEFDKQPSVNMSDISDMSVARSDWKRSVKEVKINTIFATVNLLEHLYNVIVVFDDFCENQEGRQLGIDERIELLFGCLLHDFGKSLNLARHYGFVENMSDLLVFSHQIVSARYIDRFLDVHFQDVPERTFKSLMLFTIQNIVEEHHEKFPQSNICLYLRTCDQSARKIELARYEKAQKDEK